IVAASVVAIRLWSGPFPVLTVLAGHVAIRVLVYVALLQAGYDGTFPPPIAALPAGLAVELWLLLPFNRGRGVASLISAGALFGLVWAPLGYQHFLPYSVVAKSMLGQAFAECILAGTLGVPAGLALLHLVQRITTRRAPAPTSAAVPTAIAG